MHASIAFCVMMVGGCLPPESEITIVPLKDNLFGLTSIQDLEWKERTRNVRTMPQVPTLGPSQQSVDDTRTHGRYQGPYSPYDQRAPQPRMGVMPSPPTDAGPSGNGGYQPGGYGQVGGGQAGGYQPGGGYTSGTARNDLYTNAPGRSPVSGYGGGYAAPTAQSVAPIRTVANITSGYSASQYSVSQLTGQYGLPPSSTYTSAGDANKPFNGYQPPSGNSPWNGLYAPTNNGTLNPYTTYVQPAVQQQNFNSHISEQINGVLTSPRYNNSGTPGMEVNTGGNGLVNPNTFQSYKNF